MNLSWYDLKPEDIIGGDLETREDGRTYRGTVSDFKITGNEVEIKVAWVALLTPEREWQKWSDGATIMVKTDNGMSCPRDVGDGRIQFTMPYLGYGILYPKSYDSHLDPALVKGAL